MSLPQAPTAYTTLFGISIESADPFVFVAAGGGIDCCGTIHAFRSTGFGWVLEDIFGTSAASDFAAYVPATDANGARVIVGSPSFGCDQASPCGRARLFVRAGIDWHSSWDFFPPEADVYPEFGAAVAMNSDQVFVGAPLADGSGGANTGAVYVFQRASDEWQYVSKLLASDDSPYGRFGDTLALADDLLAVGATCASCASGNACGAVYVFRRGDDGWIEEARLVPSDVEPGLRFGAKLSLVDERLAVGAPRATCVNGAFCGTVYVFERSGEAWIETARLTAFDAAAGDGFGEAVALSGDTLVVGSYRDDCASAVDCGSVYVHTFSEGAWHLSFKTTSSAPDTSGQFGRGLALFRNDMIVGAPFVVDGARHGVVSVHPVGDDCDGNGVIDGCDLYYETAADCNRNGVPDACDLARGVSQDCGENGLPDECEPDCQRNGVPDDCDLAAGASQDCNADLRPDECGIEHACHSGTLGPPEPLLGRHFGRSVAGDGYRMIVGETCENPTTDGCGVGAVHFYRLERGSYVLEQTIRPFAWIEPRDRFGWSVAIDGDWAAVAAPTLHCSKSASCGGVFLFRFEGGQWALDGSFTYEDTPGDDVFWFGQSIAMQGDTLAIGSPYSDCPNSSGACGAVYVLRRSGGEWTLEQRLQPLNSPNSSYGKFGTSVAIHGNVIVGGAPSEGGDAIGAAHVFRRGREGWTHETTLSDPYDVPRAIGNSLAVHGDVIVLGAPGTFTINDDHNYRGAALIYQYDGLRWVEAVAIEPPFGTTNDLFGHLVALNEAWLAVVAQYEPCITETGCSAVYLYMRGPFGPLYRSRVVPPSGGSFRHAVLLNQDELWAAFPWASCAAGPGCGAVYALALVGPDCDCDGVNDICQRFGDAPDANENSTLDRCEADLDFDLDVDLLDVANFVNCFSASESFTDRSCAPADFFGNAAVDLADYRLLVGVLSGP